MIMKLCKRGILQDTEAAVENSQSELEETVYA